MDGGFSARPDPGTKKSVPPRKDAAPPEYKANKADVGIIVTQFKIQKPNVPQANDYVKFTYGVEGWGLRPDGSSLPAHNHGHAWVGGIMNNTSSSPDGPDFLDASRGGRPDLAGVAEGESDGGATAAGADRVMDRRAESYDDLLDTEKLGYSYDSVEL